MATITVGGVPRTCVLDGALSALEPLTKTDDADDRFTTLEGDPVQLRDLAEEATGMWSAQQSEPCRRLARAIYRGLGELPPMTLIPGVIE